MKKIKKKSMSNELFVSTYTELTVLIYINFPLDFLRKIGGMHICQGFQNSFFNLVFLILRPYSKSSLTLDE
jgi:hypothetical protein